MRERIEVNPNIQFGKPCVAGTRIPVQNVLELVREGIPFEEIIQDYYPDLQIEDIRACIQYAMEVVAAEGSKGRGAAKAKWNMDKALKATVGTISKSSR
jgi:uncharacterized protein (DUF433 family)